MLDPDDELNLDLVYAKYLRTCAMLRVAPMSREQAKELGVEFIAILSGHSLPSAKD
jgi:hypothetical protein